VPFYNVENGKSMSRAAIIFGIVALHNPSSLNERVRKAVADSLISQLGTEVRNIFRSAVIELLGSAFDVWEPYIVTMKLFKALFEWIPKVAPNFDELESLSDPSLAMTVTTATKTLVQIISFNSLAVMPFWLAEVNTSKSLNEKLCALYIFTQVMQVDPYCIKGYVAVIVDMMVRFLDPSIPTIRSAMHPKIMGFINDLARQYAFVDYTKESQRLLVGGMDGVIVLFDLKTATRSHTFEGQTRGVTALSFSADCKHICSYSFEEVTVRVWNVPSGFLSILNMVCRPIKTIVVNPDLTAAVSQIPENLRSNAVKMSWIDENHVQITLPNNSFHSIKVI
jgi:WD40 repeat protein